MITEQRVNPGMAWKPVLGSVREWKDFMSEVREPSIVEPREGVARPAATGRMAWPRAALIILLMSASGWGICLAIIWLVWG